MQKHIENIVEAITISVEANQVSIHKVNVAGHPSMQISKYEI